MLTYKGDYMDDTQNGKGEFKYKNGARWVGQVRDG